MEKRERTGRERRRGIHDQVRDPQERPQAGRGDALHVPRRQGHRWQPILHLQLPATPSGWSPHRFWTGHQGHGRGQQDCAERRSQVDSSDMTQSGDQIMTRTASCLLIACIVAAPPPALAGQSGAFIVRLATDTLALERYTRSAGRLEGEQVVRAPRTVPRLYSATFGRAGAIERSELVTHNVSGGPGPAETKATMQFAGDSVFSAVPDRDSMAHQRVKVAPGTLPWPFPNYALPDEIAPRARAASGDRYPQAVLPA